MATDLLLHMTLDLGVPLEIARLRDATPEQLQHLRDETADHLSLADASIEMLSGRTAGTMAALIRALAVMAYAEGGVTAFGKHFCTDHAHCMEVASS